MTLKTATSLPAPGPADVLKSGCLTISFMGRMMLYSSLDFLPVSQSPQMISASLSVISETLGSFPHFFLLLAQLSGPVAQQQELTTLLVLTRFSVSDLQRKVQWAAPTRTVGPGGFLRRVTAQKCFLEGPELLSEQIHGYLCLVFSKSNSVLTLPPFVNLTV